MPKFNNWFTDNATQGTAIVNVKHFGAVADWGFGNTDNRAAFQAAIDFACASYPETATVLYSPKGAYLIKGKLTQTNQLIWRGEGMPLGLGSQSGTLLVFDHSDPGCIYMDASSQGTIYIEGTRFEDIGFYGVNQTMLQHCIYRVYGDMLANGGMARVFFANFTGYCHYFSAASAGVAYDQNVSYRDIITSVVGGFYGTDPAMGLSNTLMDINNFTNVNGCNTAFLPHAYFDFRTAREIQCQTVDIEGGILNDTIFTFGSNNWAVVDGLHIENGPPVNVIELVTGGYPYGGDYIGPITFRNSLFESSGKYIKFNNGVNFARVCLDNVITSGTDIGNYVDWGTGTGNSVDVYGSVQGGPVNLTSDNLSRIRAPYLVLNQTYPTGNYFSSNQIDQVFLNLQGQWLDNVNGGIFQIQTSGLGNVNFGMRNDSAEGRVFEIVSPVDGNAQYRINCQLPADLVNQQLVCTMRSMTTFAPSDFLWIPNSTRFSGASKNIDSPTVASGVWTSTMAMEKIEDTAPHVAFGSIDIHPPTPTGTMIMRIAALYVGSGTSWQMLIGGGALGAPITWRDAAPPTYGDYVLGDTVINSVPASGQPKGWVCTTAGTIGSGCVFTSLGNL